MVSPSKGIFHCFGCGAGGNVFTFLMKFKGISFPDAVHMLGEKVGIRIQATSVDSGLGKKIESIYHINKETALLFAKNLEIDAGEAAKKYLHERHIDTETLKLYQIGMPRGGLIIIADKDAYLGMIRLEAKRAIKELSDMMFASEKTREKLMEDHKFRAPSEQEIRDVLSKFI